MFFVISGFLITGLLLNNQTQKINIKRFYLRRSFKIIPQYLICILTGLFIQQSLFPNGLNYSSISCYFLFYQNYTKIMPVLAHTWSIAIEEHFYLAYPLLLQAIFFIQKKFHLKTNTLLGFTLIFLIILGNYLRYLYFYDLPSHFINDASTWQKTHIRFDALLFGCFLKICEPYFQKKTKNHKRILATLYFMAGSIIYLTFIFRFNKLVD